MKFIKTKLGLSVMALAFAIVGAVSLSPATAVKADGLDMTGFTMSDGAAVRLAEDYNGISWVTNVSQSFYTTNELTSAAKFGAIVAPTASFTGELTHETVLTSGSVVDIQAKTIDASEGDVQYRAVINYANLGVANQAEAYKLELTARAYVKVGDAYYYAAMGDTSRSARQVAAAAELAGEIDLKYRESSIPEVQALAAHAEAYYGGSFTKLAEANGDVGTPYIDKEHPATAVNVAVELDGEFDEAIIGAKKLNATYSAGNLAIADATGVTASGETYVTVFTSTGVYLAPIIVADKVFTQMSDFEIFKAIRNNYNTGKITPVQQEGTGHDVDLETCKLSDYYLLGKNLDATDYNPGTFGNQSGWTGNIDTTWGVSGLGLTGTFNGYGHYVENYTIRDQCGGLFDLVNFGTIKNFAMTGVKNTANKYSAPLAYYAIGPKVENVYIQFSREDYSMTKGAGMFYYLVQRASGDAKITNAYINADFAPQEGATLNTGSVFAAYAGKSATNLGFTDLYVVSNANIAYAGNASNAVSVYCYGLNEQADYLANPIVWHLPEGRPETAPTKASSFKNYFAKLAYRYTSVADMVSARGEAIAATFTAEKTGGCFTTVDGVPTWIAAQA